MKLLSYTTAYFAGLFLLIIAIWATVFYFSILDEIYDSIDDGLDNQKGLIIQKAAVDSTVLTQSDFEEKDYQIIVIPSDRAVLAYDEFQDTSMYMQNEDDFEPVRMLRTVFHRGGKYYQLSVTTSMVEEDDLTRQLLIALVWLYGGLVIVLLLLNSQLLKRIWRPFYHLLTQLKKFRVDNPIPDVTTQTKVEEFQMLGKTVQSMMERNAETYSSQKQFIENASHELQTPLAISINKLESLAETASLDESQAALLSSAIESLERMTRMNRSLLLLSRIENKQFHEIKKVEVNSIVKQLVDDFADQVQYRKLGLLLEEGGACFVQMNPELAVILITNLIKNAITHSRAQGEIRIRIGTSKLVVSNRGEKSLDKEKLFTRFQPGRNAQSTGLGLAIAHAICSLYGFSISYQFFEETHSLIIDFQGK